MPFADLDLEKLYAYGRMLLRKLPRPEVGDHWEPGEDVVLSSFKLQKGAVGDLPLKTGEGGEVVGPTAVGTGMPDRPREKLSTIIEALNTRFGLNLPDHIEKVLDGVVDGLMENADIRLAATANDKNNFGHTFIPAFEDALADQHTEHEDFVNQVFSDDDVMQELSTLMRDLVYGRLHDTGNPADAAAL